MNAASTVKRWLARPEPRRDGYWTRMAIVIRTPKRSIAVARCAVTDVELLPDATVIWPSHAWMSAMTKAAAARATTERCAR